MKRILLALLCMVVLGASVPAPIPEEQRAPLFQFHIDSSLTDKQQVTLVRLLIWISNTMPEYIEPKVLGHQILVYIWDFRGNGIAGADWNREEGEPHYMIALDTRFFTHLTLAEQRSILIHEVEHLNLYSQGYRAQPSDVNGCLRVFHEQEALGEEIRYSLVTGLRNMRRYGDVQVRRERAKLYLDAYCRDHKYK